MFHQGIHPRSRASRSEAVSAYLFLLPALITFVVFVLFPVLLVIVLSFTKYNVLTPPVWNDYKNWIRLTLDARFTTVMLNSLKYMVLLMPMQIIMGLLLAVGVTNLKSRRLTWALRTVYYFPTLLATSSVALLWGYLLNTDLGILNYYLGLIGIPKIPWLTSSFWVYPSTMLFSLWKFVGGNFLYFYIGLQSVDRSLLEAASIDGADSVRRFFSISLPMLSPTLFFVMTTLLIGTVQIFDEPFLLTKGGPGDASRSLNMYIYETAFNSQNYGYASAMALILLAVVLLITLIQFRSSNAWVSYDRD